MVFSELLQRFVDQRPIAVMTRIVLEKQFSDQFYDMVFENIAQRQYVRELAFSTCAKIMTQVVLGKASSVHAAFVQDRKSIPVSVGSLYEKLQHIEPAVCEELVRRSASDLNEVVGFLSKRQEPIAGYRLRIVDGNVLAASEHRLKELRGSAVAAMPGLNLVLYDYATGLISALVACEEGQASERPLFRQLLPRISPGDLILLDRNFCTSEVMLGIRAAQAAFLVRHHAGLALIPDGPRRKAGKCRTGKVATQMVRLKCGMRCRAIIITRDKPLKNGGRRVILLTNLPRKNATPRRLAELYLKRWSIEEAFRQLTEYLSCEVRTLGYPKAALFAFTLAVLAYNTLTCIQGALDAAQPASVGQWSAFYLAWEVRITFEGMQVALPEDEWQPFAKMDNKTLAGVLRDIGAKVDHARYAKHPRSAKKKVERKKMKSYHVSTAKLLKERELQKNNAATK